MQTNDMLRRLGQPGGGVAFLGFAAILYGIACFLQGDFAIYWQPVPDGLPLRQLLAYLSAGLLMLGGAGLLIAGTVRPAAILLLILFGFYDVCYVLQLFDPRTLPKAVLGVAEQTSVVVGSWAILLRMHGSGSAGVRIARILFAICAILFGLAHLIGLKPTAQMVPAWIPGGQVFWAVATGIGHLAVALALITNRLAVPATRLGTLMYVCFALFVWLTGAIAEPTQWLRWAGVAISLCMAAALWLVGDLLAARNAKHGHDAGAIAYAA
jgi:uncharacterized membrane protein